MSRVNTKNYPISLSKLCNNGVSCAGNLLNIPITTQVGVFNSIDMKTDE
jgi:hypothetical protein